jgi:NADH dehydrogenase/NADH:ubiquinone oxidoreductase subunit G
LVPATWDEAYDYIAEKLTSIKNEFGPDYIGGISSARCTNEENYLMQKFIRAVIGTNNIDSCARVCHSPTALGMQRTFGTGAATNSVEDLKYTDCILVIGANPTDAHPVTGAKMKQFAMKGTSIVIDPRRTEIARYATYHLQLRPGTNVAVVALLRQGTGKEHALLLAERHLTDRRVTPAREADAFQGPGHDVLVLPSQGPQPARVADAAHHHNVRRSDRQVEVDVLALWQIREAVASLGALGVTDAHRSSLRRKDAEDRPQESALAGPIRPDQPHKGPSVDAQTDAVQRQAVAQTHGNTVHSDRRRVLRARG